MAHLMVHELHTEDIRDVDDRLVLRVVHGRGRDIALYAPNLLPLACEFVVLIGTDLLQGVQFIYVPSGVPSWRTPKMNR